MFWSLLAASGGEPVPITENLVFVIAGQSNAVGWETGAPSEAYLNDPIPRTKIWNGTFWSDLQYGVNNEGQNGHGIELNLGYLASQLTTGGVYIIKLAQGSTALGDEAGTTADWSTTGVLFPNLVAKYNTAIANLTANEIDYNFKGFWWNQGERDANDILLYQDYAVNLANLETRVRTQFTNGATLKNFITVRLSSQITRTYLSEIRAAQETKNFINTDDLALQGDNIHHTSASQNIMAQRFIDKCF